MLVVCDSYSFTVALLRYSRDVLRHVCPHLPDAEVRRVTNNHYTKRVELFQTLPIATTIGNPKAKKQLFLAYGADLIQRWTMKRITDQVAIKRAYKIYQRTENDTRYSVSSCFML